MCKGNLVIQLSTIPKRLEDEEEELKYDIENFNWDIKYKDIPSACQLYLQALSPAWLMLWAYELDNNIKYLELTEKIILSWIDYSNDHDKKNSFKWYDHSTSDRALVLIYFIIQAEDSKLTKFRKSIRLVEEQLIRHAKFLFDDNNYTTQNHGTMMDRSLYILAQYIDNSKSSVWIEKAKIRLVNSFSRDFSKNMINLENSTSYHLFNLELYINIEKDLLNKFNDTFGSQFRYKINKAIDYIVYLCKPNNKFPMFGDGPEVSISNLIQSDFYEIYLQNENLKYLITKGKEGEKPKYNFKVFSNEGYSFYRSSWNMDLKDTVYYSFLSGYLLRNHKHADDLSITMFANGQDILVDSGTYIYENGEYRDYFVSSMAHNGVVVDRETYPYIYGKLDKIKILRYGKNQNYYYVTAINSMYSGTIITRNLYITELGNMIIHDHISSNNSHEYSQIFNLAPNLQIKIKDMNINITSEKMKGNISIKQLFNTNIEIIKGDVNKNNKSLYSDMFYRLKETEKIIYSKIGKEVDFVSAIIVNDLAKVSFDYDDDKVIIIENNNEININTDIFKSNTISKTVNYIKVDQCVYKFKINGYKNSKYAWYIIKDDNKKDVIWYSDKNELIYAFNEVGSYRIEYFIQCGDKKEAYIYYKKIVVTEDDINKSIVLNRITKYTNDLISESMKKIGKNKYEFKLNSKLRNMEYAWYILDEKLEKEDVFWYENRDNIIYEFKNKGVYKVRYFIKDSYDNKIMKDFDEIIIIE